MAAKAEFGPILGAAKDNDASLLTKLLAAGASANVTNPMGQTPLHVASLWGNLEVSALLIEAKADLGAANQFGVTPLHYAAQNTRYEVARLLVANGARKDAVAQDGRMPHEMAKEDEMRVLCGAVHCEPCVEDS